MFSFRSGFKAPWLDRPQWVAYCPMMTNDPKAEAEFDELVRVLPPDVVQDIANRVVDEAFRSEGFLAPMSAAMVPMVIDDQPEWFALARKVNRFAQHVVGDTLLEGSRDDPKPVAIRLLSKSNRAFQAAILLAERGMCAESETMSRTCLEITFWLGYLAQDADAAVKALLSDEWKNGGERAAQFAELMEDENAAQFRAAAEVCAANYAENKSAVGPKALAKLAGMESIYPYYKALCGISAHPSIASLDRFLEKDAQGRLHFKAGPDYDQVEFSLMTAINVHLWGLANYSLVHERFDDDQHLTKLRAERDALMMKHVQDPD
jgi:hypothetical protein